MKKDAIELFCDTCGEKLDFFFKESFISVVPCQRCKDRWKSTTYASAGEIIRRGA